MFEYDVIILGAGISGLLLGSELSKEHSVLILEKDEDVPSNKYWLTDYECTRLSPELNECHDTYYQGMDFIAYDETTYRCYGNYCLWNTGKLIKELKDKLKKNNALILNGYHFYSYKDEDKRLTVFANEKTFQCRLLIDCMGFSSPIIYAKNIISILGYYILYGGTIRGNKDIYPVGLHNVTLGAKASFLEAFPAQNNLIHMVMIIPEKQLTASTSLKNDFNLILTKTRYSEFVGENEIRTPLSGIIPVGKIRRKALNRIYFYGEAGQVNPASSATGLTRMLYTYKLTSKFISGKLRENKLSQKDLCSNPHSALTPFNRRLHVNLYREILRWNSDTFLELINECNRINNHDLINDIMFGTFDSNSIKGNTFLNLLKTRSKILKRNILKALFV